MTFTDLLLDQLEALGIQELFGIPGDFILPLLADIEQRQRMPFHYLSHEPAVTFCADAAARITNRPAAVLLTYGAGALNAVNSVAQAYEEHVPLIVIAGFPSQHERERGLNIHHQAKHIDSQQRIYADITCCQVRIDNPKTATQKLQTALAACRKYARPVFIEVARDAYGFEVEPATVTRPVNQPEAQHFELVTHIQKRLRNAKRPVILAGVDVRRFDATTAVEHFSAQTGIPIVSTFLGRAVIHNTHPNFAGVFLDDSDTRSYRLLMEADLILAAGVIQTDSNFAANSHLLDKDIWIDLQQNTCCMDRIAYTNVQLSQVFHALTQCPLPGYNGTVAADNDLQHHAMDNKTQRFSADIAIQTLHQALIHCEDTLPFVTDVGDCLFASLHANPSLCLAPAYYASMGYAIPAAYGIQAATGLRPVVLVGDGAFLMTGLELGHFQRQGYTPIVILFNNRRWDMIDAFSPQLSCTALDGWDYGQLSRSMGCEYYHADGVESLRDALAQALERTDALAFIEIDLVDNGRTDRLNRFAHRFLNA